MKFAESDRVWHEVICPECQAVNWITSGKTDRCDDAPPAVVCWKCAAAFGLVDKPARIASMKTVATGAAKGQERP